MSTTWVFLVYGGAFLLAIFLLFLARAMSWYWHVLSVLVALVIGLVPIPHQFSDPKSSLVIGFVFTFLFFWGVAAPFFRRRSQAG